MATTKYVRHFTDKATRNEFSVEIEIDFEAIAATLAARANHAKTGKSTLLNGDVKCKIIARRPAAP